MPYNWYVSTEFDSLFGFSEAAPPPVFFKFPAANNSRINERNNSQYDFRYPAQYLLLASGQADQTQYNICQMSMSFRRNCSTRLQMSMISSKLSVKCDDPNMSYDQPIDLAQEYTSANWTNLAYGWAEAIALDTGISDNDAATPYMLAELAPLGPGFESNRPALVESLAILAAHTLLDGMVNAPFNAFWPYNTTSLNNSVPQFANARVKQTVYRSGIAPESAWQYLFFPILGTVFVLNLACFSYLLYISVFRAWFIRGADPRLNGLGKDYTETEDLFRIALNSPAPRLGSPMPGAKNEGSVLNARWHLREAAGGSNTPQTPSGSPTGELNVVFVRDEEELRGVVYRGKGFDGSFLSPPLTDYRGRRPRKYTPLGFEDASYEQQTTRNML